MFSALTRSLFGDSNAREIKKFTPMIDAIAGLEEAVSGLDDEMILLTVGQAFVSVGDNVTYRLATAS